MTLNEIWEKVKTLSPQERDELAQRLSNLGEPEADKSDEHWGESLNELMDEVGPIAMKYPEIEDPVEWVKHLRAEQKRRRLGDWGEAE